jgi:2-polyprenyl-3-methyl-5-hydroxy-6-metoxy-1,4-benzoquinol methylase
VSDDFVDGVDHQHSLGGMNTGSQDYDQTYYDEYAGNPYDVEAGWMTMFREVAKHIVQTVEPSGTALDAGCAKGFLVEALAELGVDSEGIDISEHAVNAATAEVRPRLRVGSLTEPFGKRYDVITCIEVLEHMPFADSELAIDNICVATDQILFSSTPRDYREPTHINVRSPQDWAASFARRGFYRRFDVDASYLTWHAVSFVRRDAITAAEVAFGYEGAQATLREEVFEKRQALLDLRRAHSELATSADAGSMRELREGAAAFDEERASLQQQIADAAAVLAELESHYTAAVTERDQLRVELATLQADLAGHKAVRQTLEEHRDALQRYASEFAADQAATRTRLEEELERTRVALEETQRGRGAWRRK